MIYYAEPLSDKHDRAGFSCGKSALDSYLADRALVEATRRITNCYVRCAEETGRVLAFYKLSAHTFSREVLSNTQKKRIPPTYSVPAVLIGRLAVDQSCAGAGIGGQMMIDALARALETSRLSGVYCVAVEAKDAPAVSFYQKYGFIPFRDDPEKLFLPMKTIQMMFENC